MLHRVLAVTALLAGGALACEPAADSSRIAVAGGSLTEILYLLGAEDRIVAVDITSDFPPEASGLPSAGYVRALSVEGLLSLAPSLILGEDDMGPPEVLTQLERTGVEVTRVPETPSASGILAKVRCVAGVLDLASAGERVIGSRLAPQVEALAALANTASGPRPRVGCSWARPRAPRWPPGAAPLETAFCKWCKPTTCSRTSPAGSRCPRKRWPPRTPTSSSWPRVTPPTPTRRAPLPLPRPSG